MDDENYQRWLSEVADKQIAAKQKEVRAAMVIEAARKDLTRPILEQWMAEGYEIVTWEVTEATDAKCTNLDKQQWTIDAFLSGLAHDAPMFERSHVGDRSCRLRVTGSNLTSRLVDSFGNISEE